MPNVPEVLSSIAIIIAAVILYIQNHRQGKVGKEVKTTLTENNGGSSVKDRLDAMDARLFRIESILLGKKPKNE